MRRLLAMAPVMLLVALLAACGSSAPTEVAEARPRLPQLIQITVIPEPTAVSTNTPTATPTLPAPTATPTLPAATPAATSEAMALRPARVASFDVGYTQGFPVTVTLTVRGAFDDLCSEIGRVAQARTNDGLAMALYLNRPRDRLCVTRETPFEIEVPLDISGLDVGVYALSVNGIAGELRLQLGMVETHNPDLLCPEPGEGQAQARLARRDDGYCFLYPQEYSLIESDEGVIVTARQRSDVPVPLIGEVRIVNLGAAGNLTLQSLAEQDVALDAPDLPQSAWSRTFLGHEPAIMVSPVPGDEPTRRLYALHDGSLYRVTFAPQLPAGAGEQATLALALFELVSGSFVFYD
jgi:hypothetical protein